MRLISFTVRGGPARLGAVVTREGTPAVVDLALATGGRVPTDMTAFLALGDAALDEARRVVAAYAAGHEDPGALVPLADVSHLPVVPRPGKIICAGLNYVDHVGESGLTRPERAPAFAKFASSLIGHEVPIAYPSETGSWTTRVSWPWSSGGRRTAWTPRTRCSTWPGTPS